MTCVVKVSFLCVGRHPKEGSLLFSLYSELCFELTLLPLMETKFVTENEERILVAQIKICITLLSVLNFCILLKIRI